MAKHHQYFRKFPLTTYRGVPCTQILRRVGFTAEIQNYFNQFYQHTIEDGQRLEDIAYDLYGDVDLDWLIYHANDIIDPYYDVPLDTLSFENYIVQKYGSRTVAQDRVYAYRSNWRSDPSILGVSDYAALDGMKKRFYEPTIGNLGVTLGYSRKQDDDLISTNQIISIQFASEQSTLYNVGDVLYSTSGLASEATIVSIDSTTMILQHIEGSWQRETNFSVRNKDSSLILELNADSYTLITNVIDPLIQTYYKQYSTYDFERDANERKRDIYLPREGQASSLNKQLDDLMK